MRPLYENYCEDMKADLGIELCKPNDVKRCGYNDNCNPAFRYTLNSWRKATWF